MMMYEGRFFLFIICCANLFLSGCLGQTHSAVQGNIWVQQDMQGITPETLLIVDVSQGVFSQEEAKNIEIHRQKRMEDASKPKPLPPLNMDEKQQADLIKKQNKVMDYLELNQKYLTASLVRDLNNNGINVISSEEIKKNPTFTFQKPLLTLNIQLLSAESGKKDPAYITAGLGTHRLVTEVKLMDQRPIPAKECLAFEVKAEGWKPSIVVAPKWNPLASNNEVTFQTKDAEKTVHEITPIIVQYFVNQHWLEPSFAPDFPGNKVPPKTWRQKILFWWK